MLNLVLGVSMLVSSGGGPSALHADLSAVDSVYVIELTTPAMRDLCESAIDSLLENAHAAGAELIVLRVDALQEVPVSVAHDSSDVHYLFDRFWCGLDMASYFDQQVRLRWVEPPRVVVWVICSEGPATQFALGIGERYVAPDARLAWGDEPMTPTRRHFGTVSLRTRSLLLKRLAELSGLDGDTIKRLAAETPAEDAELPGESGMSVEGEVWGAEEATAVGLARGTAASLDELLDIVTPSVEHAVNVESATRILEDWSTGLAEADESIRELWAECERATDRENREGAGREDRMAARSDQLRCLREMLRTLRRYKAVLDPHGQVIAQLEIEYETRRLPGLIDRR